MLVNGGGGGGREGHWLVVVRTCLDLDCRRTCDGLADRVAKEWSVGLDWSMVEARPWISTDFEWRMDCVRFAIPIELHIFSRFG